MPGDTSPRFLLTSLASSCQVKPEFYQRSVNSMSNPTERTLLLQKSLQERILILDGGMGTMIQSYRLSEQDYRGERFADFHRDLRGNNDLLCLTQPDIIRNIHRAYLERSEEHTSELQSR